MQKTLPFKGRFSRFTTSLVLSMAVCSSALADDIDVFTAGVTSSVRPNILFVLDFSGSMKKPVRDGDGDSSNDKSRIEVVRAAIRDILSKNANRINAGISIYSDTTSGILWPVSDPSAYANSIDPTIPIADNLRGIDIINAMLENTQADGYTATVNALGEAALYFSGGPVAAGGSYSGNTGKLNPGKWDPVSKTYSGARYEPHPATYTAYGNGTQATYNSPIVSECQANLVVLLSDGNPTRLDEYKELTDYLGSPVSACENLTPGIFPDGYFGAKSGVCAPEIAAKMNSGPQVSGIANSKVRTFAIGFNIDAVGAKYLKRVAADSEPDQIDQNGKPGVKGFIEATKPGDLTAALDAILTASLGETQSFTELAIDIDKANFSDDNRAFIPLFRPSSDSNWEGNLKGYFIDPEGLKDTNNLLATETDGGGTKFVSNAQSFWSAEADGNDVTKGGASAKLKGTNRNILTFTGNTEPNSVILKTGEAHKFEKSNTALTTGLLGIANSTALRDELIDWLHAAPMGDPLHSKSLPVKYDGRQVVFQMTNQGLLHAFDATTPTNPKGSDHSGGEELFAFIPPELLPNLEKIRNNDTSNGHIYGLDGGITRWHTDDNNDGIVNGSDKLVLIFGMRRGGNNYYALDVTNPESPRYEWKIEGGSAQFPQLAQSWSRMALVTVNRNGNPEKVLVFGGGYDAAVMDGASANTVAAGNSVFMVDSAGKKIWQASHSDMQYSIPSDVRVIDSDNDGNADRIYTGDLGGQLWRIDFDNVNSSAGFTVNKLASLSNGAFQPFFYPPSVSLNNRTSDEYLSVSIGSGNRANPMNLSTTNKIYMVKDHSVDAGPPDANFATVSESSLYDATANNIGSTDQATADAAEQLMDSKKGWYINLSPGEKALSEILTFEDKLHAATFSPTPPPITESCAPHATAGRYYQVDIRSAGPVTSLTDADNDPDTVVTADRSKVIRTFGIPSAPVVVFGPDSTQIAIDRSFTPIDQRIKRVMWHPKF